MADALRTRIRASRLGRVALTLSIAALAVALLGAIGSGQEWWHFRTGFLWLRIAFFTAIFAGLLAILAWYLGRRGGDRSVRRRNLLALLIAAGFVVYLGSHVIAARSVPAIHDVTTNLADMPRFYRLPVRADNLERVPTKGREDLRRMGMEERWKAIHRESYGDLATVRMPGTVAQTIARAEAIARKRDWEFVTVNPDAGIMEATATSFFFRFKDDIVLRARPAPGGGTLVDMRSISRVGGSDIGVNAGRVRSFLKALQTA